MSLIETTLHVDGMSCRSCVGHVQALLAGRDGVERVEVDLEGKRARVAFDPARVSATALAQALSEAEYPAAIAV